MAIAYSSLLRLLGNKEFDVWYKIQAGTVSAINLLAAILVLEHSNAGILELADNFIFALLNKWGQSKLSKRV